MASLRQNGLRSFYYFRLGYGTYFVMAIGAINLLTSTYFLAIKKVPWILSLFPSFEVYAVSLILAGIPVVVFAGWLHLKRMGTYSTEVQISNEALPYNYKLAPGYQKEVFGPAYLAILRLNMKKVKGEKLTQEEILDIKKIEDDLHKLIEGGYSGRPPKGAI